jgi:hypothetical protein
MTESDKKIDQKNHIPKSWSTAKTVGLGVGIGVLSGLLCVIYIVVATYIMDKSSTPAVKKI